MSEANFTVTDCDGHILESTDYPHEVDFVAAKHEIQEMAERPDLSHEDKQAILGGNAKRFFKL